MAVPCIKGPSITLRSAEERDIETRVGLGRDPEYVRMCGGSIVGFDRTLTHEKMEAWYRRTLGEPYSWVIDHVGACIGGARLHGVDETDRRALFAIGIFDPSARGKGFGTEATRLVLGYAFDALKLHRVGLRVLEYNHRAIACYEKCGFTREGVERESALIDGVWYSDVMMGVLESEFMALRAEWGV